MTRTPKKNGDEVVPAQDQLAAALEITNPHMVSDQLQFDGFETKPQPQAVADLTDAEWYQLALAGVAKLAATGRKFQAHDVATRCGVPEPRDGAHMWGSLMSIARAGGLVVSVAATPSSRPRVARSLTRLWIGAKFAPKPADNHIPSPRTAGDDEVGGK